MSKKKSKLHKLKMPPLTKIDKALYILLIGLTIVVFIAMPVGQSAVKDVIAFSDNSVLAYDERGYFLFALPFLFILEVIIIVALSVGLSDRKPIFGDKSITYGPPRYPSVYPVFMRNKPKDYIRPSHKKFKKWYKSAIIILLASTFVLVPFSLFGRVCLKDNVSIEKYNGFNVRTQTIEQDEMDTLTFRILLSGHKALSYNIYMDIKTLSGRKYTFMYSDFYGAGKNKDKSALDCFEFVKSHFPDEKVFYERTDLLEELIEDRNFNQSETAQVYELFDVD